jgi:hypothetical protein
VASGELLRNFVKGQAEIAWTFGGRWGRARELELTDYRGQGRSFSAPATEHAVGSKRGGPLYSHPVSDLPRIGKMVVRTLTLPRFLRMWQRLPRVGASSGIGLSWSSQPRPI